MRCELSVPTGRRRERHPLAEDRDRYRATIIRSIGTGRLTTRIGVSACPCKRTWTCTLCGKAFRCWNTWPFLWAMMPKWLRRRRLCRCCYGTLLFNAAGKRSNKKKVAR